MIFKKYIISINVNILVKCNNTRNTKCQMKTRLPHFNSSIIKIMKQYIKLEGNTLIIRMIASDGGEGHFSGFYV